ncbi:integrase [Cupriavidus sp. HMR-1]|uniref:integrase n=1 Tax=Cupriavidus sp. HMR-1 TaxID=1249621 RepID=UPI001F4988EE|nr:integrase [Cupriavidus sp. HMR-1]
MPSDPARRRKSMVALSRCVDLTQANWLENAARLIAGVKTNLPFTGVRWGDMVWDVSASYRHRTRGYKACRPVQRLLFTQHRDPHHREGLPLSRPFADIVKALVCMRHRQRGQSAGSHMVFIRATRYVFEVLAKAGLSLPDLRADHLDLAAAQLFAREMETSSYKVVGHMEEFADALDRNGLCRARLDWRSRNKVRPRSMIQGSTDDFLDGGVGTSDRLPTEDAIRAIGQLYQTIPSNASSGDPVSADRILILITTIMVCTGLRVGEALTLPERPLSVAEDGSRNLRYARLKGRLDDVAVEWCYKPLLSATEELVQDVVSELQAATGGARRVAQRFRETGVLLSDIALDDELDSQSIQAILGLQSRSVPMFLISRKIPYEVVNRRARVKRDAFLAGIALDHWSAPVIPGGLGKGLDLHESLCVVYRNQLHRGTRSTLTYAAQPVTDQNMGEFLSGRTGCASVFERYGILGDDGQQLRIRTHGLRHFLNHVLDEGGAPDLVQTKWFGRKHAADTRAYQHLTYAQRSAKVVKEIMGGRMQGHVVDSAKALPAEMKRTFLAARIHAIHDVGPGMCIHDFQLSPCERHLQCTAKCEDFLWIGGDAERCEELKRQAAVVHTSLRTAAAHVSGVATLQPDWQRHLKRRYAQLMQQLATLGLGEADLRPYLDEGDRHGKADSG